MAKKQKEEPKVDNEVGSLKVKEKPKAQPTENTTEGNVTKVKEKTKQPSVDLDNQTITKVDLSKPQKTEEDAVSERETEEVSMDESSEDSGKMGEETPVVEEIKEEKVEEQVDSVPNEEAPVLEDVTDKVEEIAVEAEKAIKDSMETGKQLPENIQKLVDFMDETGGDLTDYVRLNQDYSNLDNHTLLKEYYKSTKPHLNEEEIDFLMEDSFAYDEDEDDDKDIKRKKLALKEQVAGAKNHLDGLKSKYYEDIKSGSKLTDEQQKAVEFFNRYNEESKENKIAEETFNKKTSEVFNDSFKGFEYNIGDKKFRLNIKDSGNIKEKQSNISNFVGKFLDRKNRMLDAKGYHKSLYTAMNADAVANHFYEQGKADALKESVAKSKNISMDPRQQHSGEINTGGIKVKVLGDNSSDFKFKIKNNK